MELSKIIKRIPFNRCSIRSLIVISIFLLLSFVARADDTDNQQYQQESAPKTVLVTGSNRGIGIEFVRQYASNGYFVIATCRSPDNADALHKLAEEIGNIAVEQLDVTDAASIEQLHAKYARQPIHLLINNAALLGSRNSQAFGSQDYELALTQYAVNALGPLRVSSAFIDNVRAAGPGKIITLGSAAGANGYLRPPADFYSYRASKAAQHFLMHNLALDLATEGIVVGLLNPGLVDTRGFAEIGPNDPVPEDFVQIVKLIRSGAITLITPAESVSAMRGVINDLTPEQSGKFINYDGTNLPW